MNPSPFFWLQILAIAVSAILMSSGCGDPHPSGCESPYSLEDFIGEVLERADSSQPIPDENSVHPYSQEDMYLEVVSDSEVRVYYERGGEVVVERFSVSK